VSGIVEKRHTLPILSNVLLETDKGILTLLANDKFWESERVNAYTNEFCLINELHNRIPSWPVAPNTITLFCLKIKYIAEPA
jgi:hypothetical protein